ncbi:guanylate kinase [Allomyces macrogynus ATCC 38327]|uniref:Guanylate kinase n=1 Tax=Allomyces macrogynus (strain ATCC 38327) TaxID=578462 RepID=A0A0L0SQH5_ALLM3|nr:guanylate kinase [Allomyces macrogynus ATCC 38327]|eukprot:KNE64793.1 guanylate kinase [Allomyces macrogynus ATCC 38327]
MLSSLASRAPRPLAALAPQVLPLAAATPALRPVLPIRADPLRAPSASMSTVTPPTAIVKDNTRPLVLSGPSGAGKSTLLTRLFKEYPGVFGFSVSHTTRKPRDGEVDGVSYYFTTRDKFQDLIAQHAFIEWAEYSKNLYGSSVQAVKQVVEQGKICILDIDMQGVKIVKNTNLNARYVFVQPPSLDVLEARLKGRGTESAETLADRLAAAKAELEYAATGAHDYVIINNNIDEAYDKLTAWIKEHYQV